MILILVVTVIAMVGTLYFVTSETAWDAFKHLGRKGNDVWDRFDNHINTRQPKWYTYPLYLVGLSPVVTYDPQPDLAPKPRSEINR